VRELPPGSDLEFSEHVSQMPFDGLRGDVQVASDLGVGAVLCGEFGDSPLGGSERIDACQVSGMVAVAQGPAAIAALERQALKPGLIKPMASNFEMTYYFLKDAFNTLNYAMLDANGNTIGTFHYLIAVGGDGSTASEFHVDSGNISGDASGTTLDVKDPSGTVHTINGDHAQAQAATLKAFCAETPPRAVGQQG